MKIRVIENESLQEEKITIECQSYNQHIQNLIDVLKHSQKTMMCQKNKSLSLILLSDIYYIESLEDKTFVYLKDDVYETTYRLYELEEMFKNNRFVRISKSCLLNLKYLESVKVLIYGKYEATLKNNEKLVISRKYMPSFKKVFGL